MTDNDRTIASIGKPRHPTPPIIANHLRDVARTLDNNGRQATRLAELLAARGYPTSTIGDGGASNGASILVIDTDTGPDGERVPVTTTEAAALHHNRWADTDQRLAQLLRLIWTTGLQLEQLVADLIAHADDVDEIPAGTGSCTACDRFCNPRKDPNDRLRGGLCDACRKHWERTDGLTYDQWLLARRQLKGHTEGAADLTARFTTTLEHGNLGDTG